MTPIGPRGHHHPRNIWQSSICFDLKPQIYQSKLRPSFAGACRGSGCCRADGRGLSSATGPGLSQRRFLEKLFLNYSFLPLFWIEA